MDEVIRAEGLSKSYGGRPVVRDLGLCVGAGEVFGLLGANGAGKTTSVECLLGVRKPDAGTVRILGMDPQRERRRLFQRVGVQFQEGSHQAEIRVDELCRETACLYGRPADWRALTGRPQVVFLDELTTGLDVKARRDVWRTLEELKHDGLTIFLTSHFMDEVEALCDRVLILRDGREAFSGTVGQAVDASPCGTFEDAYLWFSGEEPEGPDGDDEKGNVR